MSRLSAPRRLLVLAVALVGALAACSTPPQRPVYPDIRFTDRPPFRVDVAAVDVISEFRSSIQPPYVEHLFPVTPERAMENWARDRLQPTGTTRRLRVRIIDASVREVELPKTGSVFTTQQGERYDASVEMAIDLIGEDGYAERTLAAKATRSQTVPENITPNQRDQVWYDLTRAVMTDLDHELERQIRANLTFYVQ